ncbi:7718_t:CDS:2, partial [Gigaspora rosea]
NVCLKRLLHSSNISLCELLTKITRLLDIQNRENEYTFWKLSIPTVKNQDKNDESNDSREEFDSDNMQTSFNQLISLNNIQETWAI